MLMHKVLGTAGKPWLVFFNALGCDWSMWDEQVSLLSADRQILLLNKPGHGGAPLDDAIVSIEDYADAVISVMDGLDIIQAEYCGLSIGGRVGTVLGSRYAKRFSKLALVCGGVGDPSKAPFWAQRIQVVQDKGMIAAADASVSRWFPDDFASMQPQKFNKVHAMVASCDAAGYVQACKALQHQDTREAANNIAVPALVVAGADDASTPIAELRAMSDMINGAQYVELDAGHIMNVENPNAFNRAFFGFLGL